MATGLVYDPAYLQHRTGRHPENADRLRKIVEALEGDPALWDSLVKISPRPVEDQDITRCHSSRLIDHLQSLCGSGESFVDMDTVICADSYDVSRLAAGAVVYILRVSMNRISIPRGVDGSCWRRAASGKRVLRKTNKKMNEQSRNVDEKYGTSIFGIRNFPECL